MAGVLDMNWISSWLLLAVPVSMFFLASAVFLSFKQRLCHEQSLYYKDCSLNSFIIAKCKLKERPFTPHSCLRSRHLQTILTCLLPAPEVTYEREYLQMRDRGVVAIDWVTSPHVKLKRKPTVVLVLPALSKGALSVTSICHAASTRGMQPVVINYRGHGGSVLTTAKLLSLGDPSDLRQVITYLKLRMPRANLTAVAYGTGCGLLLSYLGEFGSSALLTVAVCISPCYNEPFRFSTEVRSKYDLVLLLRLKAMLCRHAKALSTAFDVGKALSAWTFWDFHQAVSGGSVSGYSNLEDFWESNNSLRDVDDISIPILCVNSSDDPVTNSCDIPHDLFKCYPNFLLILTQHGGHCGFWEGLPPTPWADSVSLDYVEAVIEFTTKPSQHHHHHQPHHHQHHHQPSSSIINSGRNGTDHNYYNNGRSFSHSFHSRRSFNRSFSSSSYNRGSNSSSSISINRSGSVTENGGAAGGGDANSNSGMRATKTQIKRCRFTI